MKCVTDASVGPPWTWIIFIQVNFHSCYHVHIIIRSHHFQLNDVHLLHILTRTQNMTKDHWLNKLKHCPIHCLSDSLIKECRQHRWQVIHRQWNTCPTWPDCCTPHVREWFPESGQVSKLRGDIISPLVQSHKAPINTSGYCAWTR